MVYNVDIDPYAAALLKVTPCKESCCDWMSYPIAWIEFYCTGSASYSNSSKVCCVCIWAYDFYVISDGVADMMSADNIIAVRCFIMIVLTLLFL